MTPVNRETTTTGQGHVLLGLHEHIADPGGIFAILMLDGPPSSTHQSDRAILTFGRGCEQVKLNSEE
jgi:hypothetical protein